MRSLVKHIICIHLHYVHDLVAHAQRTLPSASRMRSAAVTIKFPTLCASDRVRAVTSVRLARLVSE